MKIWKRAMVAAAALGCAAGVSAQPWDLNKDQAARVEALLNRMSLEDQIGQLVQYGWGSEDHYKAAEKGQVGSILNVTGAKEVNQVQERVLAKSKHKIPVLFALDVIHGYRTIFPVPLAESCSWEPELARRTALAAAREAHAYGLRWTFAPMVDIARDPRWGRIMEGSGEDPLVGSVFAAARVKGFQAGGLAACVKHFAAYGAAFGGRDYNAADVNPKRLFDTYLPPFKAGIDAGAMTLMSGFNTLNDVPVSGDRFLMTDILRSRWGFRGMVVSDWGSIGELMAHGVAGNLSDAAHQGMWAGIDMDMHAFAYRDHLARLVKQGAVDESAVREAARRVLAVKEGLDLWNTWKTDPKDAAAITLNPQMRALAKEAAIKSCVLLKNDKVLPFNANRIKTLAVIGPLADDADSPLGPWAAKGEAKDVVSVLEGLKRKLGDKVIVHKKGCDTVGGSTKGIAAAAAAASQADAVVLVLGEHRNMSGEAYSRTDIRLPGHQLELAKAVVATGKPVAVVLMNGRPLALPWLAQNAGAILEAWYLGVETGPAVADLLFGDAVPEGKLTVSFPHNVGQVPLFHSYLNTGRPKNEKNRYTSKYLDAPNTALYPFGHGLSYTKFAFSGLRVSSKVKAGRPVKVQVTVKNTGSRRGTEVVQLYLRDEVASVSRPVQELKAFKKVTLEPGESRRVRFELTPRDLAFIGRDLRLGYEPGSFQVRVGPDSVNGPSGKFEVTGRPGFYELENAPGGGGAGLVVPGSGVQEGRRRKNDEPIPAEATGPVQ